MSLVAIKQYMMSVKIATLANLCEFFKADPEMIRCLMRHWMKKGCIRQCTQTPACGSKCFKCPAATVEMYEWITIY